MRIPFAAPVVLIAMSLMGCSGPSAPRTTEAPPTVLEPVLALPTTGTQVALRAENGKFVCADLGRDGLLVADRSAKGEWETLTLEPQEGGRFALLASNKKYVSADRERGSILIANRDAVGEWELFELIAVGDGAYNIRSSDGKFVSAAVDKTDEEFGLLSANRDAADTWERFTLLREGSPAGQP